MQPGSSVSICYERHYVMNVYWGTQLIDCSAYAFLSALVPSDFALV